MRYDIIQLFKDHGIKYATEGNKHCQPGWVQVKECPYCGDEKFHLGFNLTSSYFNCWKCGWHSLENTIAELLSISDRDSYVTLLRYEARPSAVMKTEKQASTIRRPIEVAVPGKALQQAHLDYLIKRGYDPKRLDCWELSGTGAFGDYKFRIICPIYYKGHIVSYQGRDITDKAELRWKTCPSYLETRDHKHCLGGSQLVRGNAVAVMEGFSDIWRFGPGAVCTFGTAYLLEQVKLLKEYKRLFIVLDSKDKDPNAAKQAEKLGGLLMGFSEVVMVELDQGDPGDVPQDEADYLMKEWGIRKF